MEFPIRPVQIDIQIEKPPGILYAQGSEKALELLKKLPERGLAVVGTRRPQPRAEGFVRKTLLEFKGSDLIILSGLALGIDACAHKSALEAGLPTIAILGCGLNHQYPIENQALRRRILENDGLVLSEYEPDELAQPHYFLNRNRLIAAFSKAVWIAQAPYRSGALNTAKHAHDVGRLTYITPAFPGDPSFAGNQILGDRDDALPVWSADSFSETWIEFSAVVRGKPRSLPRGADSDSLLRQVRRCTAQAGGVHTAALLDWAFAQGLSPLDFFERLQKAQQCGLVSESNGVLSST